MNEQVLTTFTWHSTTGLAADDVVNTFHFFSPDAGDIAGPDVGEIRTELVTAYTSAHAPGTQALASYYSETLSGDYTIKTYDLSDTEPRVPVDEGNGHYNIPGTDNALPREVALCISYTAALASGDVRARRRGRIYTGPYNAVPNGERPSASLVNACAGFGAYLKGVTTTNGFKWAVRSQLDDVSKIVTGGWVDNEWDTVRRRGFKATARTTW